MISTISKGIVNDIGASLPIFPCNSHGHLVSNKIVACCAFSVALCRFQSHAADTVIAILKIIESLNTVLTNQAMNDSFSVSSVPYPTARESL